ncbi:ABC transporter permease [Persicobacter psychrovividus]|uniref:ABC transporter permease n=1 Tax=Persicobacter psychrovividus TaxID=387638 RepID=A0ABN6L4J0_9BACT|nr:ABC transporter permease [Persicobacter psychrovividus]
MDKVLLIIKREYLTRVRKKSFVVMTLLGPLLFVAMWAVPIWLAQSGPESKTVHVIDQSGMFAQAFTENKSSDVAFVYEKLSVEDAKEELEAGDYDGLLLIPRLAKGEDVNLMYFSEVNPGISLKQQIRKVVSQKLQEEKLKESGLSKEWLAKLNPSVGIRTVNVTPDGDEAESHSEAATVIGYIGAFMIYFFIFLYGTQVMRGVIEEKSNRIVEVIISSVRPFQLMMGKIIGVAGVVLTQFLIWIVLSFGLTTLIAILTGVSVGPSAPAMADPAMVAATADGVPQMMDALMTMNFGLIAFSFIFYFLGGYLLYAALFAAVGSTVDQDGDYQQFMFPLSMPLLFAIISLTVVIQDPHGTFAFWMSMIPFTSPIVMMMRVPFGVPIWQLALSMILLVGGFIFTTWLAARIYRIGILMNGSKVNYRVLLKWARMKY